MAFALGSDFLHPAKTALQLAMVILDGNNQMQVSKKNSTFCVLEWAKSQH